MPDLQHINWGRLLRESGQEELLKLKHIWSHRIVLAICKDAKDQLELQARTPLRPNVCGRKGRSTVSICQKAENHTTKSEISISYSSYMKLIEIVHLDRWILIHEN